MNKTVNDMKARAKKFSVQLEIMEKRKKGELQSLIGSPVTIRDFGYLKDKDSGNYVVFIIDEDTENFYFGGMVLTNNIQELESEGFAETIRSEGLPVLFGEKRSKNKQIYTTVTFYPEF